MRDSAAWKFSRATRKLEIAVLSRLSTEPSVPRRCTTVLMALTSVPRADWAAAEVDTATLLSPMPLEVAFTVLNEGFPASLAGRANTAINLTMFAGTFVVQWGIGIAVDAARAAFGWSTAEGLQFAFLAIVVLVSVTYGWFLAGWRRHAILVRPAEA